MLTDCLDQINQRILYDANSGIFSWKSGVSSKCSAHKQAGSKRKDGAIQIKILGENILAHRLAWFISYGELPSHEIDHIDCDKSNNRLANLRAATRSQNAMNRKAQSNNSSGHKGVRHIKALGKFVAQIGANGKQKHLGVFNTAEEASSAYSSAAIELHGAFARLDSK